MSKTRFLFRTRLFLADNLRSRHRKALVLFVLLVLSLNYYFLWSSIDDFIDEAHRKNYKVIQLLTERFIYKNWDMGELGAHPLEGCAQSNCYVVKKDTFFQVPIERSDAVVVHSQNLWLMKSRSSYKRNPNQLWVYFSMEPQHFSFCSMYYDLTKLDDWFNVTATFRADSTIVTDYRSFRDWSTIYFEPAYKSEFVTKFVEKRREPELVLREELNSKPQRKSFILWFVSHCDTPSKREDYVHDMIKHVGVDVYGSCGKYYGSHGKKSECDSLQGDQYSACNIKLFGQYKFYLAFENSLCMEYITEKYWKLYNADMLFRVNIVPVVRGAPPRNYKKVAMPNSYINADSFATPTDLANYLNYLNENHTAYMEYFQWKFDLFRTFKDYHAQPPAEAATYVPKQGTEKSIFCQLCSLLHNQTYLNLKPSERKVWHISSWFGPEATCRDRQHKGLLYYAARTLGFCI